MFLSVIIYTTPMAKFIVVFFLIVKTNFVFNIFFAEFLNWHPGASFWHYLILNLCRYFEDHLYIVDRMKKYKNNETHKLMIYRMNLELSINYSFKKNI